MKLKDNIEIALMLLVLVLAIVLGIAWQYYRWQVFQDITDDDISFIKYLWLFGEGGRR